MATTRQDARAKYLDKKYGPTEPCIECEHPTHAAHRDNCKYCDEQVCFECEEQHEIDCADVQN